MVITKIQTRTIFYSHELLFFCKHKPQNSPFLIAFQSQVACGLQGTRTTQEKTDLLFPKSAKHINVYGPTCKMPSQHCPKAALSFAGVKRSPLFTRLSVFSVAASGNAVKSATRKRDGARAPNTGRASVKRAPSLGGKHVSGARGTPCDDARTMRG